MQSHDIAMPRRNVCQEQAKMMEQKSGNARLALLGESWPAFDHITNQALSIATIFAKFVNSGPCAQTQEDFENLAEVASNLGWDKLHQKRTGSHFTDYG